MTIICFMKKIDIGCGISKRDHESIGLDIVSLPGVDVICNIER